MGPPLELSWGMIFMGNVKSSGECKSTLHIEFVARLILEACLKFHK